MEKFVFGGALGAANFCTIQRTPFGGNNFRFMKSSFLLSLSITVCLLAAAQTLNGQCQASAIGGTLTCDAPQITISGSSNMPDATFEWSGPSGFSSVVQFPVVTVAGVYSLTITSAANGCTATAEAIVTADLESPVLNVQNTVVLSCITPCVSVIVNANGGSAPYLFLWSTGQTGQVVELCLPGTYFLTVTGANGCTASAPLTVAQDVGVPLAEATASGAIDCNGGTLQLGIGNSSVGPQYTYSWTGPQGFSSTQLAPIVDQPGTYCLVVTDAQNGCTATACISVVAPAPIFASATILGGPFDCNNPTPKTIVGSALGGALPYTFEWSTIGGNIVSGTNSSQIIADQQGAYIVTVTDANGCTGTARANLSGLQLGLSATTLHCDNSAEVTIQASSGQAPYTAILQINGVAESPAIFQTGQMVITAQYPTGNFLVRVDITDALGCAGNIIWSASAPETVAVDTVIIGGNGCDFVTLFAQQSGGVPFYAYQWAPIHSSSNFLTVQQGGNYTVTVTDAGGCTASYTTFVDLQTGSCGIIRGRVAVDENKDCLVDTTEAPLGNWLVVAAGQDTFFGTTDADGRYQIRVFPGNYDVFSVLPNGLWLLCQPSYPAIVPTQSDTATVDIPIQIETQCPAMSVDVTVGGLRRCFSGNYIAVEYFNHGTAEATNASVQVQLDPFLTFENANVPVQNLGNGLLKFDIGNVASNAGGSFFLWVTVSCNAILGQTHCVEAHVFPDSSCLAPNPQWSGAHVELSANCGADSLFFNIKNTGTGDMKSKLNYVVIEDGVMFKNNASASQPGLAKGAEMTLAVPKNGATWRLEVQQEALHPGQSNPALTVEGCTAGASFSTGYATQLPPDDADPWLDIECRQNVGSFDPNDKIGFPAGFGPLHYIRPGTDIEYLIRFQNTGTDTAFHVVVRDTLDGWLDPATIQPGASSHPYRFELKGRGIAVFDFENIGLPDSSVNHSLSNGFVKFRISPKADVPLETDLHNRAAIYFDHNPPVGTNTTKHRVGENFILANWQPTRPELALKITPNPMGDLATVELAGLPAGQRISVKIFDSAGRLVFSEMATAPAFQLRRGELPEGFFLLKIETEIGLVGLGKLVVR